MNVAHKLLVLLQFDRS